jgi:hypothetical protein
MRARGGPIESNMKVRAKGGGVKSGPAWEEGKKHGTHVQPSAAKSVDMKNMHRGKPITYSAGGTVKGPINSSQGVDPATKLPGGGGGGAGRRAKIGKYAHGRPMREVNGAR